MPTETTYPGVYLEEVPSGVHTISGVSTSIAAFIGRAKEGPVDKPVDIFSFSDYEREFGGLWNKSSMSFAVQHFFLNGGSHAICVRVRKGIIENPPGTEIVDGDGIHITDDEIFSGADLVLNKRGLYALENVDVFNLLCIPPYVDARGNVPASEDDVPTDVTTNLIEAAVKYCKDRGAMFLIDPHSTWTDMATAKADFTSTTVAYPNTNSNSAALFFPRLKMANPLMSDQPEEYVPCGAVAGVLARTDAQRGVWKAPAGREATLVGVDQLSVSLTDAENGTLNQLGINCLRAFPGYGAVVWGARTLEGADQLASEWKYISVRRTALFIEQSVIRGIKWALFEPNDEPLWAQIRLQVAAFLHTLFTQGAFQGRTPSEAYLVKCDNETTTQSDIDAGITNIVVGFAPLKPAEFVIIKIQQLAGQIQPPSDGPVPDDANHADEGDLITPPPFDSSFPAMRMETKLKSSDIRMSEDVKHHYRKLYNWLVDDPSRANVRRKERGIHKGYRVLFCGPSGTGKKLTASVLGNETGRPVYHVDLSKVVSKYIGETEKNLEQLFARAQEKNWILFFDEADAIFGKRTGVRDAHDRYANQEVSYLLQRIENFSGLVILATNMKSNIDDAFTRRFNEVVLFTKSWEADPPR